MYQFSSKLKLTAIILMVLGAIGLVIGFSSAPSTTAEVEAILASHDAHGSHGAHAEDHATAHHDAHTHAEADAHHNDTNHEAHPDHADAHHAEASHDAHATHGGHDAHSGHEAHLEHVLHQLQNRPWAAFYVALIFFTLITIIAFAFLCIQRVAQSGWSIVLFRVMEGIAGALPYITGVLLIILILSGLHANHLFVWMAEGTTDPNSANFDPIVTNKAGWLNVPFWLIRCVIYIVGWNIFRLINRKLSVAQDTATDNSNYKKNYNVAVGFLAFFIFTESMSVWDWIMGLDPHWFSTLFGWYVFATGVVSALTVIAIVTVYLKSKGYLEVVNNSHLHDLAKFMFGFSVFWTYLWFAQFMLIWYADMPEETVYYIQRFEEYKFVFLGMVPINFILPVLMLINSDFKRIPQIIVATGVVILTGHYIDVFVMIMPATVGDQWGFGFAELGGILFTVGLFIFGTFKTISKAPLITKRNPFLHESEHFHY